MDNTNYQNLPEYEKPPLMEVVCGLLFQPLTALSGPYLGLLWQRFRDEYPKIQEVPPLPAIIEVFDSPSPPEAQLSDIPLWPRLWFIQNDDTSVIQVQRDRFLFNWRKVSEDHMYPHYHRVIGKYREYYTQFCDFLVEEGLGSIRPLQYEMTYINHIPEGEGWIKLEDIGEVFPDLKWRSKGSRLFASPESVQWRVDFVLPEQQGRLHASIGNAQWQQDGRKILILEMTVRGMAKTTSTEDMYHWFDLARGSIVNTFADLTSQKIQYEIWGKTR